MAELSSLLERFEASAISAIFNRAVVLRAEGRDLADFSTGEPHFDTPVHIRQAAKRAIDTGQTRYTGIAGRLDLRQAVGRKFRRDNALDYPPDQIVVSAGAKPLLFKVLQALAEPGSEVVIAAPLWPSHLGAIQLSGATPLIVETGAADDFKLTPPALAAAIGADTSCLLLCSPGNPSGAVYSSDELAALGQVLLDHPKVWVISDDLYEHIIFAGRRLATMASAEPRLFERTLTINGVSKGYAMTGWRIGYAGGPKPAIDAVRRIMSQSEGCPCSISQAAALAALDGPQDFLAEWSAHYEARLKRAVQVLARAPGLECPMPEGGFYLFPRCAGVIGKQAADGGKIASSSELARYLLDDWGVVVVPGPAFAADPHFRMSVALAEKELDKGLARIVEACAALASR